MSICFTWFPNWLFQDNPINTRIWGILQESGDFTWRVSDYEELVGGFSQDMMGFVSLGFRKFKSLSSKNTPEML